MEGEMPGQDRRKRIPSPTDRCGAQGEHATMGAELCPASSRWVQRAVVRMKSRRREAAVVARVCPWCSEAARRKGRGA